MDAYLLTSGFLGLSSQVCRIGGIRIQLCRRALGLALALGKGLGRNLLSRAGSRERLGGTLSMMRNQLEGTLESLGSLRKRLLDTLSGRNLGQKLGGTQCKPGSLGR